MDNNKVVVSGTKEKQITEWAERIIQQTHFETLDSMCVEQIPVQVQKINPGNVTCLFKVTELVFDKEQGSLDKLTIVLNSLQACGATSIMMLSCQNGKSELYLGAVNKQRYDNSYYLNTVREILRNSLEGNFPGIELKELISREEIDEKLEYCLNNGFDSQCITAVSCVASEEDKKNPNIPQTGIENLLEAIGNYNFTIMVLADPISLSQLKQIRQGYENLETQLSAMNEISYSIQSGETVSSSESYSENYSKAINSSISMTQSHTEQSGWSKGSSTSRSEDVISTIFDATENGFNLDSARMIAKSILHTGQDSNNEGTSGGSSDSESGSETKGETETTGTTTSTTSTISKNTGTTIQTTTKNKHIQELIDRVEWYLKWLNKRENYGMFNCCTYVISGNASINLMVASQYQALLQGEREISQPVTINTWTKENGIEEVRNALMHLTHPTFRSDINDCFSPAMLLSSKELSKQMVLPQRSIVGLSVMDYASFGREVVRKTPLKNGKVMRIGSVSHMGKVVPNQPVILDVQSMAAHSFVAGTNGSGKSNTVFQIIEELMAAGIPFLVIEPAKGEYKNVFGNEPSVKVYGTNSKKTDLLRLNPFWFNDDVSVLEHIDKLVEVFNASWAMYAAMPAVLKAAIENAYKSCGWDLIKSTCKTKHKIFPTVQDVLNEFNNKMDSTAFSEEVKGNYVGALSTRMESLCNGIYGEIFGGLNIDDKDLFGSSVVIDLSRVGSSETKSMIMGMLIIRLQEYRMSGEAMNLPLQHVTILEEAHHLLRNASGSQSAEGANMMAKSVEMISNSIAEMRSYGEGFIIVDQSPGLMDLSVMRNTNTKLILRLPEGNDREMVGKTMGLTEKQTDELSRLKTGVCAIYQKDWLEAVLCQVDRAKHEEVLYKYNKSDDAEMKLKTNLVKGLLVPFVENQHLSCDTDKLLNVLTKSKLSGQQKLEMYKEITAEKPNKKVRLNFVADIVDLELELPNNYSKEVVAKWYKNIFNSENQQTWGIEFLTLIIEANLTKMAETNNDVLQIFVALGQEISGDLEELKIARGKALKRICPLNYKFTELEDEELEQTLDILKEAGDSDKELLLQLQSEYLNKTCRQRNTLEPYASIIWKVMDGSKNWDILFGNIKAKNAVLWDSEARTILKKYVKTDTETETSILNIFLQNRGSNQYVMDFYKSWYNTFIRDLVIEKIGRKIK